MSSEARVLVVANKTAATPALLEAVRERAARGPARFTLLVPNSAHGLHRLVDPEDQSQNEAEQTLELALPLLESAAGSPVDGMIGVPEPLAAIQDAINIHGFDELIISTLPAAGVEVAQARPAVQGRRPRPAGHDRDRLRARAARHGVPKGLPLKVGVCNPSGSGCR